jgi:mono/diheme cytochrome c family protein
LKKLLLAIALGAVALLGGGSAYLGLRKPAMREPPDIRVAMTAGRIARGKYLFEYMAGCADCHSGRDFSKFGGPIIPGRKGAGLAFPREIGLPGELIAPNITPDRETGIGTWSDGEKIRAIREGVSKDGRALFPFMPYPHFARMSDEDVESVVAYLNTLPPVKSRPGRTKLDFPLSLLVKGMPRPLNGPVAAPARSDAVKYGEYLVTLGECVTCHTQVERGEPVEGMEFAGGREFRVGSLLVRSANITPDEDSGLGRWDEARFVAKFKGYENMHAGNVPPANQSTFTLMPWLFLSHLEEADLKAIYAYLRTVKPVYNPVEVHPPQPGQPGS